MPNTYATKYKHVPRMLVSKVLHLFVCVNCRVTLYCVHIRCVYDWMNMHAVALSGCHK